MPLSEERRKSLRKRIARARKTTAPENAVGQWIAGFFEAGVSYLLDSIIKKLPSKDFSLKLPPNRKTWRLESRYGEFKQIDYVISNKNREPVIIIEDKWLKDQRHLKDKGSWIMELRAVQEANPSIRGIVAILAGEWNETTIKTLGKVAHVFHISTKTVYNNLKKIGIQVKIDEDRNAFENPAELLEKILDVVESKLNNNIDIIEEVGKRIIKKISTSLEKTMKTILFPKNKEVSEKYELLITTNWGRMKHVEGKCIQKNPNELIENVKRLIDVRPAKKKV